MQSSFVRKSALAAALALAAVPLAPLAASAQSYAAANAGTGVARISYVQGAVALQRGDSDTSTAAVLNAPVLGADYVTTGAGSRAEIQLDDVTALRLGANVQLRFTRLDANERDVQLAEGTIDLRVLRANAAPAQIDTPSVAVRPASEGSFRVSVDADGRTHVAVRSGRADIVTPQGTRSLTPGTTLLAYGPAAQPAMQYEALIASDDFDRFNADRDVNELRALSDAYAPPGVAGVSDLAAYGTWFNDASYGEVWVPTVVGPGWAPYRDGRWAWEDRYGWTWIGYEPWGWAPYHYGRWFHHPHHGWAWVPSRAAVGWSPALVSFVTFGGSPGFGFDTIGWLPLAPFEPFYPWWGNGTAFVTFTNVAFVPYAQHRHNWYENARYGAVTALDKRWFLAGRFDRATRVPPDRLRNVAIVHGAVPVVPSETNLRYSERSAAPDLAVRAAGFRRGFAGDGSVTARIPFTQQRAAFAGAPHAAPVAQSAAAQSAPRRALAVPPADSWARFGAERGTTVSHGVTVMDGTASQAPQGKTAETPVRRGAHATGAWSRFEASSPASSRAETSRGPAVVHDLSGPHDAAPRTTESTRTNDTASGTTRRAYDAPHAQSVQPQYTAPAPPAHPQYVPPQSAPRTTQSGAGQQSTHSGSSQGRHAESSSGSHH
ncbi:MAG TPA: DUF6600 domain-containing protein [Candidatus Elarobacter sp.]|jgi:hypothetical protein|nr:DUF6600 domain-containing protein [Candidatus Elarobacter sp.]